MRNQSILVDIQFFCHVLLKREGGLLTSAVSFLRECVYVFQYHLLTLVRLKRDFKSNLALKTYCSLRTRKLFGGLLVNDFLAALGSN